MNARWTVLALLLAGCASEQRCLRRFARVERQLTVKDTVVWVPETRVDTLWRTQGQDTLVVHKDRVEVRVERRWDTLRIAARCLPETLHIPRVREVIRTLESAPRAKRPNGHWLVWIAGLGAAVALGIWLRR